MTQSEKCQFVLKHADLFRGLENAVVKLELLAFYALTSVFIWIFGDRLDALFLLRNGASSRLVFVLFMVGMGVMLIALMVKGNRAQKHLKNYYNRLLSVQPQLRPKPSEKQQRRGLAIFAGLIATVILASSALLKFLPENVSNYIFIFSLAVFNVVISVLYFRSEKFKSKVVVAPYVWLSALIPIAIGIGVLVALILVLTTQQRFIALPSLTLVGIIPSQIADSIEGLFDHRLLMQAIRWRQTSS
jgi:hypothetical protein